MEPRTFTELIRFRLATPNLAALPSTRAIETRLLPSSLAATHRGFAFYACRAVALAEAGRFPQTLHSLTRDVFDAPLAQLRTATLRGLTVYPSASQHDVFYVDP